jgi:hypothetical protein
LADTDDRVALRWLVGMYSNNANEPGYRRVRQHCENTGLSPWAVMDDLTNDDLQLPHTGIRAAQRWHSLMLTLAAAAAPLLRIRASGLLGTDDYRSFEALFAAELERRKLPIAVTRAYRRLFAPSRLRVKTLSCSPRIPVAPRRCAAGSFGTPRPGSR